MGYSLREFNKMMGRYIPEGSRAIEFPEVNAVAYVHEVSREGFGARYYMVAYSGKRNKPDANYSFKSAEARDKAVADWADGLKRCAEYKAKMKADRISKPVSLKVGDIVHTSWGYDQTNVDFFEVVRLVGKSSVGIRKVSAEIEATGYASGNCTAESGKYVGEEKVCRVRDGSTVVNADGMGHYAWIGSKARASWYA